MLYYDPPYLLVMLVSVALTLGAQLWVTLAVRSQTAIRLRSGRSGAEVARRRRPPAHRPRSARLRTAAQAPVKVAARNNRDAGAHADSGTTFGGET